MYKLAAVITPLTGETNDNVEESKVEPMVPITVIKCDQTMLFKENMYCFGQYGGDIIYL